MRIACLGGGPAGLFFARLVKLADPQHEVDVFERNPPDATFGFGVVFSERTASHLTAADPETSQAIARASVQWEDIETRFKGKIIRSSGHGFSAIARKTLLHILQQQAAQAGAHLHFGSEISDVQQLSREYDLVFACDGVNSLVRRNYADRFGPSDICGKARYIWFGTTQSFNALTFLFAESEHGMFSVHAYPFEAGT